MKQTIVLAVVALLAACQPTEPLLPTVASLSDLQTQAVANQPTPTPTETPRALALPPTFTPTSPPSTETPIPTRARATPTPNTFDASGTLYYVVNGRQFIAHDLATDTPRVVREFDPGVFIRDLTLAPDGSLIAFVAQINPILSEVFVMDLAGDYLQQVSCLRFGAAQRPAWRGSDRLTWFAAPAQGEAGNIFQANVEGSGACPEGNNQQALVRLELPTFYGMVWEGDTLYYIRTDALLSFDPVTQLTNTVVPHTGYGPNRFPVLSSQGDIAFIVDRVLAGGQIAANASIYTAPGPDGRRRVFPALFPPFIERLAWSNSGGQLLGIGRDQINLRDGATGSVRLLADRLVNPVATFSPDDALVAYTAPGLGGAPQWVLHELASGRRRILLNAPPGLYSDPFWLTSDEFTLQG
ncbi:MAG: hypothetical protein SNJ54_10705 [Anaerolineae bacterium]